MDPKINEMDDSYADGGYASMTPQVVSLPMSVGSTDPALTFSNPDSDVQNITVYANSINPVSYSGDDPVAAFDVVFSVGVVCPVSGSTKTYQVVKRIGVDRQKMASDAQTSTPVSIVEAKQPAAKGQLTTSRLMALAGLGK